MPTKKTKTSEDRIRALEKRVKVLEERCERLLDRLGEVQGRTFDLMIGKLDDPRSPYSNWLLQHVETEDQRLKVNAVLGILTNRVQGARPADSERRRARLPPGLADRQGPPAKEEILDALRFATGVQSDYKLLQLIDAIHRQRLYPAFAEYAMQLFEMPM